MEREVMLVSLEEASLDKNDLPAVTLSECLAMAEKHEKDLGYAPLLDDEFGKDLEEIIAGRQEPLTSRWDRFWIRAFLSQRNETASR